MTEKNCIIKGKNESDEAPSFVITESATVQIKYMEEILGNLVKRIELHPSDDEFYQEFCRLSELYDHFRTEIINASGLGIACGKGCSYCCCHWVEDVSSFEGIIIKRYLTEHYPEKIPSLTALFLEDAKIMNSLRTLVDDKKDGYQSSFEDFPDTYDLLLSCFYQLERPCALLDDKGSCIIYPVRPFTCRDYLNIRDSAVCRPERINEEEATLILHMPDRISSFFEILHRRFNKGSEDMSLRPMLAELLESND